MRADRLLKLADFLENKVTDRQFDLNDFWKNSPCGSVGCALGWGGVCFKGDPDVELETNVISENEDDEIVEYSIYNEQRFFDIGYEASQYLFYGDSPYKWDITRLQEVQLIRNFVLHGGISG
jgi:hypothetical protein